MRRPSSFLPWIHFTLLAFLFTIALGEPDTTRSHTRHPHNNNNGPSSSSFAGTHHRAIRADTRSNLSGGGNIPGASSSDSHVNNRPDQGYDQLYSNQHSKLTLDCNVHINFTTSIWLKDGQIVQTLLKDNANNKRVSGHRFLVDNTGSLHVDNVRLEDDGRWQCEAEDPFGFVVQGKPVQLTVLDAPRKPYLLIDNRILDPGNLFIPVKENSDLTVSCVLDGGNPRPALSWDMSLGSTTLADGPPEVPYQALNITETPRDQKVGARSDVRLERVMRAHHNATLTCVVHHMALLQSLNVSLLLDVQYTPSFAISREPGFGFPIREGMPVSLKCDVDANPKAMPIWQKDDSNPPVMQSPDGYLNFTEIRREHSGWYKCISKHLLGRFSSIGYFLNVRYDMEVTQEPDFDVSELSSPGKQLEVALGGAVQLACPPGITGCWTRVEPNTGRLEPLGASQELRLDQVVYQESGEYRCVTPIHNNYKELDSVRSMLSVTVVVTGRPLIFPNNKTITAVYGQPLTITMEFCANPPHNKVIWLAKDRVFKPGEADSEILAYNLSNSTTVDCYYAVLYISRVTNKDIGEYTLLVRSPNGLSEGIFYINMTYASGYNVMSSSAVVGTKKQRNSYVYVGIVFITSTYLTKLFR